MGNIKLGETSKSEHKFCVLRNSLTGVNSRLDIAEENISDFEDIANPI